MTMGMYSEPMLKNGKPKQEQKVNEQEEEKKPV